MSARGYGYEATSVRLDGPLLPQALIYRQSPKHGWQATVALSSLHPNAIVRGALLYLAEAYDVATREPVSIKIVGTGEYR